MGIASYGAPKGTLDYVAIVSDREVIIRDLERGTQTQLTDQGVQLDQGMGIRLDQRSA